MKVHNFDSLGIAGVNMEALGSATISIDALRQSMN
jgi:hypothetical protein